MESSLQERGLIWIVEDSPLEAEMIRRALAPFHDAELFSDGVAMLERLATSPPPDMLLLDLVLPSLSGIEVCRVVRERHTAMALPVLILTMQARRDAVFDAFDMGVNDYLYKPVDVRELGARVSGLVRTSRAHRAHMERSAELAITAAVGLAVTSGTSAREVAERSLAAIGAHLRCKGLAIAVRDAGTDLRLLAAAGDPLAAAMAIGKEPPGTGPYGGRVYPLIVQGALVGNLSMLGDSAAAASPIAAPITHVLALGLARATTEKERVELLEREREARAAAESANRAKDEFLAILSHELRTPLNAIVGWAGLLRQGSLSPERSVSAVEKIERNALAQAQLIDDLLDVSRIISGKMVLDLVEVDLSAAVRASLATIELIASKKNVAVEVELDPTTRVMGEPPRVQQIVSNLLSNAVRFTPAGGRVTVTVSRRADGNHVEVVDTGPGIAPAFLPHIFERFTQGNTTKARSHGGLGLGLAIVRHLVSLHSGTVEARSEGVGLGATFDVCFPDASATRPSHETTRASEPPLRAGDLTGMRVLIVDDEADARELLQEVLTPFGALVTIAGSAEEALARLAEHTFTAIVSDIGMPGGDGFDLMRRVRQLPKQDGVRTIALSAYAAEKDKAEAMRAGFDLHLKKPVDTVALVDALVALVGEASLQDAGMLAKARGES